MFKIALLLFLFQTTCAQVQLPIATNVQKAYNKGTRSMSGIPGKTYWQNKADYDIKVNFDPLTRELKGTVGIDYTNNSPDTLKYLLFKLYPNLFQKNSIRTMPVDEHDLTDGVIIESIRVNQQDSIKRTIRGTNMYVYGHPLVPRQQIHIDITYSYTLNKTSFIRTGQIDSGAFFISYFFPRITVYDDIDGWNTYPYSGQIEFYNDYGHFNTEITVPADYQVWATGTLKNQAAVYQPAFSALIDKASRQDEVIDIITAADLKAGNITKHNTWQFEADSVTDFAFGISNHYIWKSSSVLVDSVTQRRTRVDAVFNPEHTTYLPVIDYARKTVQLMSHAFPKVPFPYSHETVFDGPDEMEFPMMVDNMPFKSKTETIQLTAHEVFHSLFPFYVGTNETKYAFMDEGWATLAEFYLHPMIDSSVVLNYNINDVNNSAGTEQDVPIMTLTPQLAGAARYSDKDQKPALGYLYVKEMLGTPLFLKALRFYISNWQGKHPTPYDFFNSMNTGSGVNLDWFWNNWFFEKVIPDLAISKVTHHQQTYSVTVSRIANGMVPVHLTVYYADGSQQLLGSGIACWAGGNKTMVLTFKATKAVREIVLGTVYDADVNPDNNKWKTSLN
jgi:hypothetical protein